MSLDLTDEELAKVEQVLSIYGRPPDVLMSRRLIAALRASRQRAVELTEECNEGARLSAHIGADRERVIEELRDSREEVERLRSLVKGFRMAFQEDSA